MNCRWVTQPEESPSCEGSTESSASWTFLPGGAFGPTTLIFFRNIRVGTSPTSGFLVTNLALLLGVVPKAWRRVRAAKVWLLSGDFCWAMETCVHHVNPDVSFIEGVCLCVCVTSQYRCKTCTLLEISMRFYQGCRGTWHTIRDRVQRSYLIVWDTEPDQLCTCLNFPLRMASGQAKNCQTVFQFSCTVVAIWTLTFDFSVFVWLYYFQQRAKGTTFWTFLLGLWRFMSGFFGLFEFFCDKEGKGQFQSCWEYVDVDGYNFVDKRLPLLNALPPPVRFTGVVSARVISGLETIRSNQRHGNQHLN